MALLIIGSLALLAGTFMSVKRNKARANMAQEDKPRHRRRNDDYAEMRPKHCPECGTKLIY